jgi:glycosyltransferase involved in cell wall biosynthesis
LGLDKVESFIFGGKKMKRLCAILFMCLIPIISGAKEKICLNMIVKDESRVIKRCLESVKPLIDYWVIVDTGSTDGTQEIIKQYLKNIPGELHERPWRNFGENRTEAFQLAKGKGDYILFMDADDVLKFKKSVKFNTLDKDLYNMWRGDDYYDHIKPQLVKANLPWKWVGVTHEYLDCEQPYTSETLDYVRYVTCDGGASSFDPKKFIKNIHVLKESLKKDPKNVRDVFYLAESYRCANRPGKALQWFQKRIKMGGWDEEVFWSMLQIGQMLEQMDCADNLIAQSYINAHNYRLHRIEPVYYLANFYNKQGKYEEAYRCIKAYEEIEKPKERDTLFNLTWMDEYGLLFQLSICSYYAGHYQESLDACNRLLKNKKLPDAWKKLTEKNRTYPMEKLKSERTLSSAR